MTSDLRERYSSSPEPVKLMSIQNTAFIRNSNQSSENSTATPAGFNYNRLNFTTKSVPNHSINTNNFNSSSKQGYSSSRHAITQAKVFVRVLNEPCYGYERLKTLMITFEVEDGIQGVS